nr:Glyoxalase-like domain protein [uncultured bacterium]AIA17081.1 Glyoxalase-like domain protein [uncultured bacterium]
MPGIEGGKVRTIVNIDVPDLVPAIRFYRAALGLRLARLIEDDVAELSGASSTVYLLKHPAGSDATHGASPPRSYARHWTPVHIDFVVDDIEAAARQAIAAGAIQESELVEWRGSKCVTFSDPFGHGFCVIEFEGGTYR